MKLFRRLALLGTILSTAKAVYGYWKQHKASRADGPLFGDVDLPRNRVPGYFPETLSPRL